MLLMDKMSVSHSLCLTRPHHVCVDALTAAVGRRRTLNRSHFLFEVHKVERVWHGLEASQSPVGLCMHPCATICALLVIEWGEVCFWSKKVVTSTSVYLKGQLQLSVSLWFCNGAPRHGKIYITIIGGNFTLFLIITICSWILGHYI